MEAASSAHAKTLVLLVQPNDDSLEMYAEFLSHSGLVPIPVSSAVDALAVAAKADIVVTGLRLPGSLDGIELIGRLRTNGRTKRTPIIVLTASALKTERERAQQAGCDLFLPKPCLPEELLNQVRRLVKPSKLRQVRNASLRTNLAPGARDGKQRTKKRDA
jgi:two-component system, cell cycle response regulator DivK